MGRTARRWITCGVGPVLIELGEHGNAYERLSRRGHRPVLGNVRIPATDRILKICLLLPADKKTMGLLSPFAMATAKYFSEADAGGDVFQAAWLSVSLALWEYRAGNYPRAVDWCRRCMGYAEANAPRTATAHIILAMSYHQRGRHQEAQAELTQGGEIVESKFKSKLGSPVQGFWFDWVFARILCAKAWRHWIPLPFPVIR